MLTANIFFLTENRAWCTRRVEDLGIITTSLLPQNNQGGKGNLSRQPCKSQGLSTLVRKQ